MGAYKYCLTVPVFGDLDETLGRPPGTVPHCQTVPVCHWYLLPVDIATGNGSQHLPVPVVSAHTLLENQDPGQNTPQYHKYSTGTDTEPAPACTFF